MQTIKKIPFPSRKVLELPHSVFHVLCRGVSEVPLSFKVLPRNVGPSKSLRANIGSPLKVRKSVNSAPKSLQYKIINSSFENSTLELIFRNPIIRSSPALKITRLLRSLWMNFINLPSLMNIM
jgi:hypothetical protein